MSSVERAIVWRFGILQPSGNKFLDFEASIRAQDAAIALAKEQNAELWFMYVVDIGFMDKSLYAMRPDVVKGEMEKLGEFLLAMAQERARQQSVAAEYILRHGDLRQELIKTARDGDMDLKVQPSRPHQ